YALGWSLPPFFGWSAYVPEGLLTSCSWDYMSFTPAVRAYTMLLFIFVFFLPLFFIIYCYVFIFRAIRATKPVSPRVHWAVGKAPGSSRDSLRTFRRLQSEWKMAKIALLVILLYVLSWAPYSAVALTAFAGYADMLTPYMNSVPAVIAKASAIHNPIIYAITHPKYRLALAKYVPLLAVVLCVGSPALGSSSSSFLSTRRSTVSSQSSGLSSRRHSNAKPRLSSASDSESALTDTENDLVSLSSRPASRQVSCDIIRDTELPDGRRGNRGGRDKASCDSAPTAAAGVPNGDSVDGQPRGALSRIPSIVVTSESSPFLPIGRNGSRTSRPKTANSSAGAGPV
ncbi:LOW QUALITY PROTEIN: melanopsin-A-like, partial [Menidia menidia]